MAACLGPALGEGDAGASVGAVGREDREAAAVDSG